MRFAGPRLIFALGLLLEALLVVGLDARKVAWLDLPHTHIIPVPGRADDAQEKIAVRILPRLEKIRTGLARRMASLVGPSPGPGLPAAVSGAAVARLLDDVERDVLETLAAPELAALRDFIQDFFRRARVNLGLGSAESAAASPSSLALASFRSAPAPAAGEPPGSSSLDTQKVTFWSCKINALLVTIETWARKRELQFTLAVESQPDHAWFAMAPYSYRARAAESHRTDAAHMVIEGVWRGLYKYSVALGEELKAGEGALDLVQGSPRGVLCHLARRSDTGDLSSCDPRVLETDEACKR